MPGVSLSGTMKMLLSLRGQGTLVRCMTLSWRKQWRARAEHFGISQVIIEIDSPQLREAITSSSRDLSIGGGIFVDIRNLLHDSFNCISVSNIPRSCNSSAHELAKLGMSWDPDQFGVWADLHSEFVIRCTARDLSEREFINARL